MTRTMLGSLHSMLDLTLGTAFLSRDELYKNKFPSLELFGNCDNF
jgi:hypothetical protein